MPEHPDSPPLPLSPLRAHRPFRHRVAFALGWASVVVGVSLALGTIGYHCFASLGWVDSLLNASMILTGMGPVNTLSSNAAKLFASAYALFSGLVFISVSGILLAPIFHQVLHRFHLEGSEKK